MQQRACLAIVMLAAAICATPPAFPQKSAPQQQVIVTVLNVEAQPALPVKAVRVSLSYLGSGLRITDAQQVTNTQGQALLLVSAGVAEGADLRIEIAGATDLAIYQPVDGQLPALASALKVSVLPKGSLALRGPAQIEALLHRTLLQVSNLQKQNQTLKQQVASGQSQEDISAVYADWARANGFSSAEVDEQVHQWIQAIQSDAAHSTTEQKALAEFALQHYASAAQLFNQAGDADRDALDADAAAEKAVLDRERTHLQQLIKDRQQSASASQLNLQYHQATQTLESAEATAHAEFKKHPDDRGFHELWLQALLILADGRREEAEVAPAEQSLALLGRAVADFQSAAREDEALGDHQEAAAAQTDLALSLLDEGMRSNGEQSAAFLEQAVHLFEAALTVRTRTDFPSLWADTEYDLASALENEAQRVPGDKSVALLDQAAQAYRAVLEVYTRAASPDGWAKTQMGLGATLGMEAMRAGADKPAPLLAQAAQAFRSALEVYTRERSPRFWAMAQSDLGDALATEAYLAGGQPDLFEQAIQADRNALDVYSKASTPQDWAHAEANLAAALSNESLAVEGERAVALADQSVQAYRLTLDVYTKTGLPQNWAHIQSSLGYALWAEAINSPAERSVLLLAQAVDAFQMALQVFSKAALPQDWAWTQEHLALALGDEATRTSGKESADLFDQTFAAYQNALDIYTKAEFLGKWSEIQMDLVEFSIRAGRYTTCVQHASLLTDNTIPSAEIPAREIMKMACQFASGDKSAALATERTLLRGATAIPPSGAWDFSGTTPMLAASPAFASGRASWIALFTAVQNGDGAAMTAALHQLEPVLQQ